jgi:phage recombination protein Bet
MNTITVRDNNQNVPAAQGKKASALQVMAARLNVEPEKLMATLTDTVFKGAKQSELLALVVVANEYNLNPFLKEIYAFPAKGGGIVPIVGVDGWSKLMNNHPQMDGIDFSFEHDGGELISCTATIYRKDRNHPTRVTEYFVECARNTEPWKMKHRMLRHKAEIQCARIAFGFTGIYDEDEGERIKAANVISVESVPEPVTEHATLTGKTRKVHRPAAAPATSIEDAAPTLVESAVAEPAEESGEMSEAEKLRVRIMEAAEAAEIPADRLASAIKKLGLSNSGVLSDMPAAELHNVMGAWRSIQMEAGL